MIHLCALVLTLAAPPEPTVKLVAVGGGGMPAAITQKALEMSGGAANTHVLIVPQASSLADTGSSSAATWRKRNVASAEVLDLSDRAKALEAIQAANFIWISGGDQNRLMKALIEKDLVEAFRERMHKGAVIGGTSAGAAVQSGVMITGEADLTAVKAGATITARGLDLCPGVIFDQHFLKRQRFNRLYSAVLDKPELVGIGIDEATAVAVVGKKFEVVGNGQVVVVDARKSKPAKVAAGKLQAAVGATISIYTTGMTFEIEPASR